MPVADRLQQLTQSIIAAERQFARVSGSVKLLAVSKTQPVERLQQAIAAGQLAFGENYVQEALSKIMALPPQVEWHFIGAIQANKTRMIAQYFQWVHSLDKLAHAERLSAQRPAELPPLNVCIQVNVDDEITKAGLPLAKVSELAQAIARLPRLKLRGLMTIPAPRKNFAEQRKPFHQLRLLLQTLQSQGLALDTLSMGMSNDYLAAIAEGATMVRLGTAIFGERKSE